MYNTLQKVVARHKELRSVIGVPGHSMTVLIKSVMVTVWWCTVWYRNKSSWDQVKRWFSILFGWINHRGIKWTIAHVKALRNMVTKWIAGEVVPHGTYSVRRNKDGFPSCISFMKPKSRTDVNQFRFLLTLLSILRCVEGTEEPDITVITSDSAASNEIASNAFSKRLIKKFLKSVGHRPGYRPTWSGKFHFTTKMGPNGHAMKKTAADVAALSWHDLRDIHIIGGADLFARVQEYISIVNGDNAGFIQDISHALLIAAATDVPDGNQVAGKLVAIPAPEGKTRIIAQLDYWSQEALKPLHDYVMKLLRRIPNDLTFGQNKGPSVITRQPGHSYWSIDLKNATDRFPIMSQVTVLQQMFGKDFAWAWYFILKRPFVYGSTQVMYGAGQPMGSYSSWAVFTLCHHIAIWEAHRRASVPVGKTYCILGDDVVISNDDVAKHYLELLSELGVEVSKAKTHKSETCFEIAKRWYYRSGADSFEFTPFPVASIAATIKSTPLLLQALYEAVRKGWSIESGSSLPETAAGISAVFNNNASVGYVKHVTKIAEMCWTVGEILRGNLGGVRGIRSLQQLFGLPCLPAASNEAPGKVPDSLLTNCVVELFAASADTSGQGFDDVGMNTLLLVTNPELVQPQKVQALLESIPQVQVYGSFEEQYLLILQKAWDFDTIYSGNWDLAMRSLTVPDTSRVFSAKNKDVRTLFISKVAKTLVSRLKDWATSPYALL